MSRRFNDINKKTTFTPLVFNQRVKTEVNPATQFGLMVLGSLTKGLGTEIVLGKASFNPSDKPQFIDALRLTIFFRPSIVKCSLRLIISITSLNKIKSAFFCFYPLVKNQRE